jgi:hypothetical protein
MSIIAAILVLLFAGFIMWVVRTAPLPIDGWIRTVIIGLIAFATIIYLLNGFGFNTGIHLN